MWGVYYIYCLTAKCDGKEWIDLRPELHCWWPFYLFFADDSLFLCQASVHQCRNLKRILSFYGEATGQCINYQKSSLSFGELTPAEEHDKIKEILGIHNEGGTSKYLGLPECFLWFKGGVAIISQRPSTVQTWQLVPKEALSGRKGDITENYSVSTSSVSMSSFRLLKTIIRKLHSLMENYWWSSEAHLRKIHWVSWDKLCLSKALGGIGFKDLECFNQALLAKQAWKLVNQPDCLMARFLKSRYFPHSHFLEAPMGARPSFAWWSILYGRELLQKGLKWSIGDGCNTRVWLDKWIEDPELGMRAPWVKNIRFDVNLMVSGLIDSSTRRWNVLALHEIFVPGDVKLIMSKQPLISHDDSFVWKHNKSGNLTVKFAYWLARDQKIKESQSKVLMLPSLNPIKEKIWQIQSSLKIKTFLWKVLSDALPVAELILNRGMQINGRCQTCGLEGELIHHVLFQCPPARQAWVNVEKLEEHEWIAL